MKNVLQTSCFLFFICSIEIVVESDGFLFKSNSYPFYREYLGVPQYKMMLLFFICTGLELFEKRLSFLLVELCRTFKGACLGAGWFNWFSGYLLSSQWNIGLASILEPFVDSPGPIFFISCTFPSSNWFILSLTFCDLSLLSSMFSLIQPISSKFNPHHQSCCPVLFCFGFFLIFSPFSTSCLSPVTCRILGFAFSVVGIFPWVLDFFRCYWIHFLSQLSNFFITISPILFSSLSRVHMPWLLPRSDRNLRVFHTLHKLPKHPLCSAALHIHLD